MSDKDSADEVCPKIEPVNNNITKLSYDERLELLEKEANSLYAFCLRKGFSEDEMYACVSKLRGPPKPVAQKALKDSFGSLITLSVFIGIIAVVCVSPAAFNQFAVHYKLFTIKFVLPYWNFAALYQENCMINNPWLPVQMNKTYNAEMCRYCSDVVKLNNNSLDRLNNVKSKYISKHYIDNLQPVVVTDTTKDWQSKKKLTMDEIGHIYQSDPFLSTVMGSCNYQTNVGFNKTFYDFITAYVDKQLPDSWHANWENCDTKASKVLRRYYTRPYFLPPMAQASSQNSVIAAKGKHTDSKFELGKADASGTWITVVSGHLRIWLTPANECLEKFGCKAVEIDLGTGETVFMYPDMWDFTYTALDDKITLAVASSVVWDNI